MLRELSGDQLFVVRRDDESYDIIEVGAADGIQSTIRLYPDAFLAPTVLVGEGASEVGLMRGLDQYRTSEGEESISAQGVALVDCGGGDADRCFSRGEVFRALGYRTAILRDDDAEPTEGVEEAFVADGGTVIAWRDGRALEDELFLSLSDQAVGQLIDRAIELHGEDLVDAHIKSVSRGAKDLAAIRAELEGDEISAKNRAILGQAARTRRAGWFKSVSWMEGVARDIVGPDLRHRGAAPRRRLHRSPFAINKTIDVGRHAAARRPAEHRSGGSRSSPHPAGRSRCSSLSTTRSAKRAMP